MGCAVAAQGFQATGRSALARVCANHARRGVVDPDPGDRLRRWRAAPVKFPDTRAARGSCELRKHPMDARASRADASLLPGQRLHQQIGLETDEWSERIEATYGAD